jgi:hypothetical protein
MSEPQKYDNEKLIEAVPDMLRIVRRFASIDWMGETELNMWIKKCREIVESLGEERRLQ